MILPFLAVKDVDESVRFYTEKLGFALDVTIPGPDGHNIMAFVRKDDNAIGISRDPQLENRGNGVALMLYVSDETDLDAYYEDVKQRGTVIESALKTEYWGDRLFAVKDPDGYHLSLCKTIRQVPIDEILQAVSSASAT